MMARPVRMPAKAKYRAAPTVVDGIRFASKREAQRYGELKLLEHAGEIERLTMQPRFPLSAYALPSRPSQNLQVGVYVADFEYYEVSPSGRTSQRVVEDVKGFRTPLYRWKAKHVLAQYGIQIREVR